MRKVVLILALAIAASCVPAASASAEGRLTIKEARQQTFHMVAKNYGIDFMRTRCARWGPRKVACSFVRAENMSGEMCSGRVVTTLRGGWYHMHRSRVHCNLSSTQLLLLAILLNR